MRKIPEIIIFMIALLLVGMQNTYAEEKSGSEYLNETIEWEKTLDFEGNEEEERQFRELDQKIEHEIDELDITNKSSVSQLADDLREMENIMDRYDRLYYPHDMSFIVDEHGYEQWVYRIPEKPGRLYFDDKVRCVYVYPTGYSFMGAYVYFSESGRAAIISYDYALDGSRRYFVVNDTLLRYQTSTDDLGLCWDLPEWEPHPANSWTTVEEDYPYLKNRQGYEYTYEFQSVIAASWMVEVRILQREFEKEATEGDEN